MLRLLALLVLLVSACAQPVTETADAFAVGQVWTYATRPGEEASRVIVCRIDPAPSGAPEAGPIVHVSIEGVAMENANAEDGVARTIGHMPFAEASLRASVVALAGTRTDLPSFESGYDVWRAAFDKGEGGVFEIPVADAIEFIANQLPR